MYFVSFYVVSFPFEEHTHTHKREREGVKERDGADGK